MSGLLKAAERYQRQQAADVQTVSGRIEADVAGDAAAFQRSGQLGRRDLVNQVTAA